jgi:hypothetical protein
MRIETKEEYELAKRNYISNQITRKQMESNFKKEGFSNEYIEQLMASFNAIDAELEGEIIIYEKEHNDV